MHALLNYMYYCIDPFTLWQLSPVKNVTDFMVYSYLSAEVVQGQKMTFACPVRATLAQLAEHVFRKDDVRSSILRGGSKIVKHFNELLPQKFVVKSNVARAKRVVM